MVGAVVQAPKEFSKSVSLRVTSWAQVGRQGAFSKIRLCISLIMFLSKLSYFCNQTEKKYFSGSLISLEKAPWQPIFPHGLVMQPLLAPYRSKSAERLKTSPFWPVYSGFFGDLTTASYSTMNLLLCRPKFRPNPSKNDRDMMFLLGRGRA